MDSSRDWQLRTFAVPSERKRTETNGNERIFGKNWSRGEGKGRGTLPRSYAARAVLTANDPQQGGSADFRQKRDRQLPVFNSGPIGVRL